MLDSSCRLIVRLLVLWASAICCISLCLGQVQKPALMVQTGHSAKITSVAFSLDGKTIASGAEDKTIRLWDVNTRLELRTYVTESAVTDLAFSPDGRFIAAGGSSGKTVIWEVASGSKSRVIDGSVVAYSPDGRFIATGGAGAALKIWNATSGSESRSISIAASSSFKVTSLCFSKDSHLLAVSTATSRSLNTINFLKLRGKSQLGFIKIIDVETGNEVRLLETTKRQEIADVSFSPDGTLMACAGVDGAVVWEVRTGRQIANLAGEYGAIVFIPNGRQLALSGWKGSGIWDPQQGVVLNLSDIDGNLALHPNGNLLAVTGKDNDMDLWDLQLSRKLYSFPTKVRPAEYAGFTSDGDWLFSRNSDGFRAWNLNTGYPANVWARGLTGFSSIATSPNGRLILGSYRLRDTPRVIEQTTAEDLFSLPAWPRAVAFSFDGRLLLTTDKRQVTLWDTMTRQTLATPSIQTTDVFDDNGVNSVALTEDGMTAAAGTENSIVESKTANVTMYKTSGEVNVWHTATGRVLYVFPNLPAGPVKLSFSHDGTLLAALMADYTLKFWNVRNGHELWSVRIGERLLDTGFRPVTFSPDDRWLLTAVDAVSTTYIQVWDVSSGREVFSAAKWLRGSAFSSDGRWLAIVSDTLRLVDMTNPTHSVLLVGHRLPINSVAFSRGDSLLMTTSDDGSIRIWDVEKKAQLATIFFFRDGQGWAVVTPDGLFDGSPDAWNEITWRFNNNTFDHAPVEAFFNEFYYPGLLADIFGGKRPKAPSDISQKDRRQPQLKLVLGDPQAKEAPNVSDGDGARTALIKIDVAEVAGDKAHKTGSGAQDVRLFRNGSLVKAWRGEVLDGKKSAMLTATVPIVAGENKFTAYAFNHDNIKSSDAELIVTGADSLKRQGTAYIVAIGVNTYSNAAYNLNYAVADAEGFASEVKRQQEALKRYAKIEVISLPNGEATKSKITQKLADLAKQVQPEDAVIFFFAGHGTAQGNQFYLIPHDLGYKGPRERLTKAGLKSILAHSISDRELERLFEGIDAGQLLLVIDACNSGQALEAEEKRRGPMNSKGLAQLAYEKGMYVLTAAQSYQAALEASRFGHGFLTYALIDEGLKKGSADREPKNGTIDIREWLNFATDEVPKMQKQNSLDALRGRGKRIIFVGDGREVGIPKTEADARDNIQRPRVFYRRQLEANPLIVAAPGAKPAQ